MRIYIAGAITCNPNYKEQFKQAEQMLKAKGHSVMNPAWIEKQKNFTYDHYITVSSAMQSICNAIYLLDGWVKSRGARLEFTYAVKHEQAIFSTPEDVPTETKYPLPHELEELWQD